MDLLLILPIDEEDYQCVSTVADVSVQSAVLYGLVSDDKKISQQLPVQCDSGNCTWQEYVSLAICSSCADIRPLVVKSKIANYPLYENWPGSNYGAVRANLTRFMLPNGLYIDNTNDAGRASSDMIVVSTNVSFLLLCYFFVWESQGVKPPRDTYPDRRMETFAQKYVP